MIAEKVSRGAIFLEKIESGVSDSSKYFQCNRMCELPLLWTGTPITLRIGTLGAATLKTQFIELGLPGSCVTGSPGTPAVLTVVVLQYCKFVVCSMPRQYCSIVACSMSSLGTCVIERQRMMHMYHYSVLCSIVIYTWWNVYIGINSKYRKIQHSVYIYLYCQNESKV